MVNMNEKISLLTKVIERMILTKYDSLHGIESIKVRRSSGMGYVYTVRLTIRSDWRSYTDLPLGRLMDNIEKEVETYFMLLGLDEGQPHDKNFVMTYISGTY